MAGAGRWRRLHRLLTVESLDPASFLKQHHPLALVGGRWSSGGAVQGSDKVRDEADVAIVGAGIVGLATAREIVLKFPRASVVVVEKEQDLVPHQTSHNSGVIHAGIYYTPGSDMATLCVEGAKRLYKYCEKKNLPHKRVGKLIVATDEAQLPVLEDLRQRAISNKVEGLEMLNSSQIQSMEPNIRALRALHSPNTGIVDYPAVGRAYAQDFLETGRGAIHTGFEVVAVDADERRGVEVHSNSGKKVKARWLITCGGLQSDYVGRIAGGAKNPTVLPFRGTYHELKPEYRNIITRNIYPVPDPKFPMVGVHLTPRIDGRVLIGPNSALALSKEGYKFWNFNAKDAALFAVNKGLWKLVLKNPGIVLQEIWRDLNAKAFVREAQRYCPSLRLEHTTKGWSGVHGVAIDTEGNIMNDFIFENAKSGIVLNVRNAPSPGCTSSLAIGSAVVKRAAGDFHWQIYKNFATSP